MISGISPRPSRHFERDQPVEVGERHLAHEPLHRLPALGGRRARRLRADAAQVLLQRGAQPEVIGRRRVVPLDVRQALQRQPALPGEAVAFQPDGDVLLQLVAEGQDEGFDGGFGLAVHRRWLALLAVKAQSDCNAGDQNQHESNGDHGDT